MVIPNVAVLARWQSRVNLDFNVYILSRMEKVKIHKWSGIIKNSTSQSCTLARRAIARKHK
jgi:hypothetical protein